MNARNLIVLMCLLALGGGLNGSTPAPWPVFQRDLARTGTTSAPAIRKPKVLWKAHIGIQGYLNDPVIAGGRVFVGSSGTLHNKPDAKDGVYCVDLKTGRVIWHRRTDRDACGVAFDAGRVFSTGDDGVLRGFRAEDGKELWKIERKGELYAQPVVIGGLVIVGDSEGTVFAAKAATGKIAWSARPARTNVRGGLSCDGKRLYATFVEGRVACLDLTGRVVWSKSLAEADPLVEQIYAAPTVVGSKLIVTYARDTYYGHPAVYALDKKTGRVVWNASAQKDRGKDAFGNVRSSVVPYRGLLLYGEPYSNDLVALNAKTGALAWKVSMGAPMFPHWPSPAVAGSALYLPRHDGALYAVDLPTRRQQWMLYLGQADKVGPKLPKGIMPEGWEHCAWKPGVGESLYASPAIASDGTIVLGTGQGYLFAIGEGAASE